MAGVTEKLIPGAEVPKGECELCGTFIYLAVKKRLDAKQLFAKCLANLLKPLGL